MKWQEAVKIKTVTESSNDKAKYFDIHLEDSMGFGLEDKFQVTPKVGDTIQLKTEGFSTIAGVKLNGKILYEKTKADLDREHEEWKANDERKKKADFERDKQKMDADYDALPYVFQKRIDRFRRNNPNFRWEMEPYVMFATKEAIKIIDKIKTLDEVIAFGKLDYKEQKKIVDLDDGHSGGTFGEAMDLACTFKTNIHWVPFVHSSLARIGGCESVGCLPPTDEEKKEIGL